MKILFDHSLPFALAHGGLQTQIEETKAALERRGLEVEFVRWWDARQRGDIIHFFGTPRLEYLNMAAEKRLPVVVTNLFTHACNRPPADLRLRGLFLRFAAALPRGISDHLNSRAYSRADRMVVGLKAERNVLETVFGIERKKVSVIPLGLHSDFLKAGRGSRDQPFLVTTGTITERKRSVELARLAHEARVPVLFLGKPYSHDDAYGKAFAALVDNRFVFHRGHIADRQALIELLRASRGFVIYSQHENWCLSAHEAAACGLPLLLPDLPWSRECFGSEASYLHPNADPGNTKALREFYEKAPGLEAPSIRLYSWDEVAEALEACYREIAIGKN